MYKYIDENLKNIYNNINSIKRADVRLLAVTKTVDADRINYAVSKGITLIGENRSDELAAKYDAINKSGVEIHFIGALQRRKVKDIIGMVDMIHSVDSVRLAEEINKRALLAGKVMPVLVEVNIGREENKSGVYPEHTEELLINIKDFENIAVSGLMVIPPVIKRNTPGDYYFQKIYEIFLDISNKNMDNIIMKYLSAGMSADYMNALRYGSNIIRLGTAIFGKR